METTIKHNEKEIKIYSKDNWFFDEIAAEKLRSVNEKLHNTIQKEVDNYLDNKERIDAEIQAEKDKKLLEARTIEVNDFKNLINTKYSHLLKDFEVNFETPHTKGYGFNAKEFSFGGARISYSGTVSSGQWGSRSRTTRVWVLTFNYKDRRYTTLDKAIASGLKQIEEKKTARIEREAKENKTANQERIMQKFAEDNGFEFEKSYSRSKYSRGYYNYNMSKGNLKASIYYNEQEQKVIIRSYTVSNTEGITVEDLKREV